MKTILCNLQKHVGLSHLSKIHYLKKFHLFIEELYARLYRWYMFEALSLLGL